MTTGRLSALKRSMDSGSFDPVYVFSGPEEYRKEEAVRQLIECALDPAIRDFNLDMVRGTEVSARTLESLLSTAPLLAVRRILVIRDATALKEPAKAVLGRYLLAPAADVVVILLVNPEWAWAGSRGATDVEFGPLSRAETLKWIDRHVSTALHTSISTEAAILLQTATGNDLPLLASELDKLASYSGGVPIDEGAVNAIVGIERGKTLPDLLDQVADRKVDLALPLIPDLLAQPKLTAVFVTMALTVQVLGIAYVVARLHQGMRISQIQPELYPILRGTKGLPPFRSWGDWVQSWTRSGSLWGSHEVLSGMEALLRADAALKETGLSNDEEVLTGLVLNLCGKPGREVGQKRTNDA